jgi:glycosyltransferase involved in cell wall biosynthesis
MVSDVGGDVTAKGRGTVTKQVPVFVGIPTFNNHETIALTIESLRRQSFTQWRCLIADDSPDQRTVTAARDAVGDDSRFSIVQNPERRGAAGNWNFLLECASAPLFKLLCADDVLYDHALERAVSAFCEHPDIVLVTSRRDIVDEGGRVVSRNRGYRPRHLPLTRADVARSFVRSARNLFAEPSFALYDTAALRRAGGFDSRWSYTIDIVSYLSVLEFGDAVALDESLGAFRLSSGAWTTALRGQHRREISECIARVADPPPWRCSASDHRRGRLLLPVTGVLRDLSLRLVLWRHARSAARSER